ncbi:MAG: AbrB/MazE/SpoVT family DNA-binding domain-containing protein [Dehalococcoidia bacterium]|nr:AbrB/MazE/SpoVT family DNA-binding domain-containing protein [Dehalococcoidia bacterium]
MATRVSMNRTGRITLPSSLRKLLRLEGEAEFEVEQLDGEDALVLRPVITIRRDDAWAYSPEHIERMRSAREDSRAGRVRRLSEEELDQLLEGRGG